MPRRSDLSKILVIGSGPIQIGQACEFDYSGTQAVKALRAEGYQVVLVNSNPATIMTDPEIADRTYIEPLIPEALEKIIEIERPDALLPTLGGQIALNLSIQLHKMGVLKTYGVEVLGASIDSINLAEDREAFRALLSDLKIPTLESRIVRSEAEGLQVAAELQFPLVLRPSYTLGGTGGGIVFNQSELSEKLNDALEASPSTEVLVEKSIIGWKELEFEVMCDHKDQMVVVCTIENLDPMGVHTGDSITVAPIQTLTDKEMQRLREACKQITRGVGIRTGGCNVQFALDPDSSEWIVVEMNPRVSRSSALASKATGFPIAKIAALLAVGYSLEELPNDITKKTPACFEPALDYVVVKIPRFTFEKFQQTEPVLGTQMKSVGEVMGIGRSFREALMKSLESLESGNPGLMLPKRWESSEVSLESVRASRFDRLWLVAELFRSGEAGLAEIQDATKIDTWFLFQIQDLVSRENEISLWTLSSLDEEKLRRIKSIGYSDRVIALLMGCSEERFRKKRLKLGVDSQLNQVDTCAGEFEAETPYFYFAYEDFPFEAPQSSKTREKESVVILGSGPNRIGQGVEFDYCCVKAVQAVEEMGYEAVMVNCNPETVSTDYDISDRLYFEPLEWEYVERVLRREKESGRLKGVICQTGGQTALKLSQLLKSWPILGTGAKEIDRAEDRSKFDQLLQKLKLRKPESKIVHSEAGLKRAVASLGLPVLIRPSYVLGGRAMHIVRSESQLESILEQIEYAQDLDWPILVDRFLEEAIEIDVDCVGDGKDCFVIALMEHVEEAGIHSGDSSCSIPTLNLSASMIEKLKKQASRIGKELKLQGFLNIQFAIYKNQAYVLEVNPRASRTLPYVCKATGMDWVKVATGAMLGRSFKEQEVSAPDLKPEAFEFYSVKQVVFPFLKFPNVDVLLGPEMKSTGEVMSLGKDFNEAFVKGLLAANHRLPKSGTAFVSVRDEDKPKILEVARQLKSLGFRIVATHGTTRFLQRNGVVAAGINKVKEGQPHIVDAIINGQVNMVINTTDGEAAISDSFSIRRSALQTGVPYFTNLTAARAAVNSLDRWIRGDLEVYALQDLHQRGGRSLKIPRRSAKKESKSLQKNSLRG